MRLMILGDSRTPTAGSLNYGPAIEPPAPNRPMGPNTLGEMLWPVRFEQSNVGTRIGFSHVAPTDDTLASAQWIEVPA